MTTLLRQNIAKHISLSDKETEQFCRLFKPRSIKKKDYILREGDTCAFEAFVTRGLFRVYHIDNNGFEQVLYFAIEDWWITDIDSFTNQTAKTDAVLIDAQFTLADAETVAQKIKSSGKKLTTIYVSHGDPDFYFGLEVFKKYFPEVTVYASPATIEHIKATAQKKLEVWGGRLGKTITTLLSTISRYKICPLLIAMALRYSSNKMVTRIT